MSLSTSFLVDFKECKSNKSELKKLFMKTKVEIISDTIIQNVTGDSGLRLWSAAVESLDQDEEKLFEVLKEVLPKLNRDQLTMKALNDFYSRLCMEIPQFSPSLSIQLGHFCENSIQFGDPRAPFFKEILPACLQALEKCDSTVTFDGVTKPLMEHHQLIITGVLAKPFKVQVLGSTTAMFKDIPLTKLQTELLLGKICDNITNVQQQDISGLSLACFNLALFNRLVIPMMAFDNYFYEKRYIKKFIEMDSDMDGIDETYEKGIIETEENVIFHFQHVTEFTSIEKDIEAALKPLAFAPKFIISPFIATLLVSFAKSSSSFSSNLRLPQSILLPFIKKVFKNNERHHLIRHQSAWARSVDQFEPIDIEKLLQVLQENTCKLGQNVALNGFIALAFMLLKTEAPTLNNFAVHFLNELVKCRQEFASDIMKIVVKMLFSEPNKAPIIECFSNLVQNRSLPIERCEEALKELIENLTELELDTALAIESVIYNAITKSTKLRDLMSEKMRAAMYQNDPNIRKLAVYSFCIMLKKVTKPVVQGTSQGAYMPSQNLSLMSLLSQSQLPSTEKVSMRRVSVLVLEILGILRKCFSHNADIRVMLYDSLLKAVAANPFIIPNVLELVELYFREYFDSENIESVINFTKAFKELENGEIIVMDQLGNFLSFFVGCLEVAKQKLLEDENSNYVQISNYRKIIEKLADDIIDVTMEQLDIYSILDLKASSTITQFLQCLEALMVYCRQDLSINQNITRITSLFRKHCKITEEAKRLQENNKKSGKRTKNQTATAAVPKVDVKFDCVWDLAACGEFLKLIFEDNANEKINEIRQNSHFCRFVLKSMSQNIVQLTTAPEYLKVKHSKQVFSNVKKYSVILYKQMEFNAFVELFDHFDADSAVALTECFKDVIVTMGIVYNSPSKWQELLSKFTGSKGATDSIISDVMKALQKIINWAFDPEKDTNNASLEKIAINVFLTIEALFSNFQQFPNVFTRDCYNWILEFCQNQEVNQKDLHIINKVLFQFMAQQDSGCTMMEHVAHKISSIFGFIDEELMEPVNSAHNDVDFQTINIATVEPTLNYFVDLVRKQIEDVEFCILRMNSYNSFIGKIPGQKSRNESIIALKSMEKSSVIRMKKLGIVVGRLCNTRIHTVRSNQIDLIAKVVNDFFTCIGHLMKHFTQHYDIKNIDYREVPLDLLMKETKQTVKMVNVLVPYIEENLDLELNKIVKKKGKKKHVVKEFASLSRLAFLYEKFVSIVQKFDKETKKSFSKYFKSSGEVRDFRIKLSLMPKQQQNVENDSSDDDESSEDVEEKSATPSTDSSDDDESDHATRGKQVSRNRIEDSDSDETNASSYESLLPVRRGGFEENAKAIARKSAGKNRKRKHE